MSKFNNDLVEGALVLIFTYQVFDFCKFVVDKLATMPQPSSPTSNGFDNLFGLSLMNETPHTAVRFPFPSSPPVIPVPPRVRRFQPTFRRTPLLPAVAKAEVVVRQQETKTVLVTETRVDRRHNEFTERVDKFIKNHPSLEMDLYR